MSAPRDDAPPPASGAPDLATLDTLLRGGWLRPLDHALGLALRRLDPPAGAAVELAAALASRALAEGHAGWPLDGAEALLRELQPERPTPALPTPEAWAEALRASPWVAAAAAAVGGEDAPARPAAEAGDAAGRVLCLEHGHVQLRRYREHERGLADALARLAAAPAPARPAAQAAALAALHAALFPADADPRQAEAARRAPEARLLLLTGGPGTGKTTTLARMLLMRVAAAALDGAPPPRIALAAPTGKAAARLADSLRASLERLAGAIDPALAAAIPATARTLHRLLGWRPGAQGFRHDAAHPLEADLVVVDEASMVDLPLMARLLAALPPEAGLVLVGDPDQLPSVETGDVLAALCAVPGLPRVHLARTWRQAEGLDLAPLAGLVREGRAAEALAGLRAGAWRGVHWLTPGTGAEDERALHAELRARALPPLRALAAAADPAAALALALRLRVLTALREGPSGSRALNAWIAEALAPGGDAARPFHGRLLMVTENSPRHGLWNGDVGVLWAEPDGALRAWFEGPDGVRAWLPGSLPAHEDAFALTVHKAQGSEFDEVLLVLPATGARVLARELVYTGLTRSRRAVWLWGGARALEDALARRSERSSTLAARLQTRLGPAPDGTPG